jgi:hypothetical protein
MLALAFVLEFTVASLHAEILIATAAIAVDSRSLDLID